MVMFLAVVVSFDDLHDVVQAGQAIAEWFHALDASARVVRREVHPGCWLNGFQDFPGFRATF
jgi:hypothetical protein